MHCIAMGNIISHLLSSEVALFSSFPSSDVFLSRKRLLSLLLPLVLDFSPSSIFAQTRAILKTGSTGFGFACG